MRDEPKEFTTDELIAEVRPVMSDTNDISLDNLAKFLTDAMEESRIFTANLPKPIASVSVSKDGASIDICLDNTKSTYSDWIKGEGADIAIIRDQETNRVVGAHLPLYAKSIVFGGQVLPTLRFNLETGEEIPVLVGPSLQAERGVE